MPCTNMLCARKNTLPTKQAFSTPNVEVEASCATTQLHLAHAAHVCSKFHFGKKQGAVSTSRPRVRFAAGRLDTEKILGSQFRSTEGPGSGFPSARMEVVNQAMRDKKDMWQDACDIRGSRWGSLVGNRNTVLGMHEDA